MRSSQSRTQEFSGRAVAQVVPNRRDGHGSSATGHGRPLFVFVAAEFPGANHRQGAAFFARQTVIIAKTGWGQEDDCKRTQDAGFDYHMVKPLDTTTLIELLAEVKLRRTESTP